MADTPLSTDDVLTLLATGPTRIAELTANLTTEQLHAQPAPDEWSFNDILAHLRSCSDVWGDCIATILAEDALTIRAIDPRTWMTRTNYPELDFASSFEAFTTQRTELLATLGSISPEAWTRSATITGAGRPIERTLHSFARRLAKHEWSHIKHINRMVRRLNALSSTT